jgi:Rrf2 family transcriptional repressor of oqxAB
LSYPSLLAIQTSAAQPFVRGITQHDRGGVCRKGGGIKLGRRAEEITLRDNYRSVLGGKPALTPRPDVPAMCRVSANFGEYFAEVSGDVEEGIFARLGERTVAQSLDRILELHAQTGVTGEAR